MEIDFLTMGKTIDGLERHHPLTSWIQITRKIHRNGLEPGSLSHFVRKKDRAKQTFTPSDRVLRPRPTRTTPAGPEVQAVSVVIATVKSGSKKIQSIIQTEGKPNRNRNSKTHISKITDSKMFLSTQLH